jgi:hypothetical protein
LLDPRFFASALWAAGRAAVTAATAPRLARRRARKPRLQVRVGRLGRVGAHLDADRRGRRTLGRPLLADHRIGGAAEIFDEMVDERAHLCRQMAPARVRDVDLDLRQPEIRQQPHQRAARDVAADQVARQDRNAHPEQRELAQHRGVVRDDHVGRPHAHFAVRAGEHALVAPVFGRQAQRRVLGELFRVGRHTVLFEIARRRADGHAAGGQPARDDARAAHLPRDDDADVEPSSTRSTWRSTSVRSGTTFGKFSVYDCSTGARLCSPNTTGATIRNVPTGS